MINFAGKNSFFWYGPKIAVNIMEPEAIKEILNMISDFPKPTLNPLVKLLITGLVDLEGDKWSKHRKIINPAFNLAKLKVFPFFLNIYSQTFLQKFLIVS